MAYYITKDVSLAESSLKSYSPNDILFGAMRVYFHKVCIAQEKGLTRSTCIVINAKDTDFWAYLVMLLFDDSTIKWAIANSKESTNMPYITWERFQEMPIYIPNTQSVKEFNCLVSPFLTKISILARHVRKALEIKDFLLPRLISGEIEVTPE